VIAHVSMPADDCAKVARVLAEFLDGGALRFPPGGPEAWNCWSKHNDFQIVITPRGQLLVSGEREPQYRRATATAERASECHFAMTVGRSAAEILELANAAGWPARLCDRGGMFSVVEVWVEDAYLVEVLDPSQLADYRRNMTVENWVRTFGLGAS